jgi:hypothetical protein
MNFQSDSESSGNLTLTLEVDSQDLQNADPALVHAIGRDIVDVLRNDGYTIKPVYTGQRGGFLVDIVIPFFTTTWAQKEVILADVGALVTIFTPVVLVAKHLQEAHKQNIGKDAAQQSPIRIIAEIDGAPIAIEAPDLETAEAAMKLAQRFQTEHPAVASKVTGQSKTKLKGDVIKKPQYRRR